MDTKERIFDLGARKFKDQQEFAASLNLPPSVISSWKTGKSSSYMKRLPEIAEALGTTAEYLLIGEEQKKPADGAVDEQVLLFAQILEEFNVDLKGKTYQELRRAARTAAAALQE